MHKFITIAAALALGTMWSLGPALAQTTTDKAQDKAESTKETIKDKTEHAVDTVKDKAERAADTVKDKAVRAKDKMKEKFTQAKDKMHRGDNRMSMTDTRAAQEALKTEGFDPGPIDGLMGPRTRAAINDYQTKNNLPVTGMLDDATMAKLNVRSSRATDVPAASPTSQPDPKKQSE
jgi:peptidoglycan hydrolase-like protein with peptidoglycan-binding domain